MNKYKLKKKNDGLEVENQNIDSNESKSKDDVSNKGLENSKTVAEKTEAQETNLEKSKDVEVSKLTKVDDLKSGKAVEKTDVDKDELEKQNLDKQNLEKQKSEQDESKLLDKTTEDYLVEIEDLKKAKESLLAENESLKNELKAKDEQFDRSLDEMKINNSVEIAIRDANGKNVKAIKALINFDEISLDGSGEVVGLEEQIELLKTSDSSSFLFDENELVLKGVTPVSSVKTNGISVADFQKMSYKERLELYNKTQVFTKI